MAGINAYIFDCETTGLNEPELIEAAWLELSSILPITLVGDGFNQQYKPSKPIEIGALATHHIMDEDLVNCMPSSSFSLPDGIQYLIGHNIDFDAAVIGNQMLNAFALSPWLVKLGQNLALTLNLHSCIFCIAPMREKS